MKTYAMINDTGTPIRQTVEQLYNRMNKRLIEHLHWKLDIERSEAESQIASGWLILLEKLEQDHMFLAGKPFGWVWSFVLYRAMSRAAERARREEPIDDEIIAIKMNSKPNRKHARFTEEVDFWLDFQQAATKLVDKHQHNDLLIWSLYLTITGRKPEILDWHDTKSKRADRTGKHCAVWCPHTRKAMEQILGYKADSGTVRKARRLIQLELQLMLPEYE